MNSIWRAVALTFAVTGGLGIGCAAVGIFWIGDIDPKLGAPADQFGLVSWVDLFTAFIESIEFGLIAAAFLRFIQLDRTSALVAASVMAIATMLFYPANAANPFCAAVLNPAVAFAVGAIYCRAGFKSKIRRLLNRPQGAKHGQP